MRSKVPAFRVTAAIRALLLSVGLLVAPELSTATGDSDLEAVIDFPPNRWLSPVENLPPGHHGHGVERDIVVKELKAAGFTIEETPGKWPTSDYCVIARKPSSLV